MKDIVIKCISQMDTETLSLVLDNNRTYQESTKLVFIGKLEEAFRQFQSKGNTELIPSMGSCGSEECANQGCKGVSFFGNVSNDVLSLIIEEKDGVVTDIYNCDFMIPENGYWEITNQITLNINQEDKANFIPNIDFLITQQDCEKAINYINKYNDGRITNEDASHWLTIHKTLMDKTCNYLLFGGFIKAFRSAYLDIERVYNLLSKEKQAHDAMINLYLVPSDDEEAILSWLVKYEEFGQDLEYYACDLSYDLNEAIINGSIPLKHNNDIHYLVNQSSKIPDFINNFGQRYWNYVKNISSTGNSEEIQDYYQPARLYLKEYVKHRNIPQE